MDAIRIPLVHDKGYALIDAEDLPLVENHRWSLFSNRHDGRKAKHYAITRIDGHTVYMHTLIFGALRPDHKNGDGLDNRRANLRVATRSQNGANAGPIVGSSQFKGVHWDKSRNLWVAEIKVNKKRRYLGRFDDEVEAAQAYDAAALEAWGEYAYVNFP